MYTSLVVLSYVDEYLFWYTYEELGKCFVDKLVKRFQVNFLLNSHWFMSNIISQLKDYSISVDQASYATAVVSKYLDIAKIKENFKFHKTSLPNDMVFTK